MLPPSNQNPSQQFPNRGMAGTGQQLMQGNVILPQQMAGQMNPSPCPVMSPQNMPVPSPRPVMSPQAPQPIPSPHRPQSLTSSHHTPSPAQLHPNAIDQSSLPDPGMMPLSNAHGTGPLPPLQNPNDPDLVHLTSDEGDPSMPPLTPQDQLVKFVEQLSHWSQPLESSLFSDSSFQEKLL